MVSRSSPSERGRLARARRVGLAKPGAIVHPSAVVMASDRVARRTSRGFAYLLLMMALAVVGIAASFAVTLGAAAERRDAERHLLFVGGEFERALVAYAATARRGPRELSELLRDPRVPGVRRHLRQIYADPLTGSTTWGLVRDREGFIIAVHSLARGTPIRRTGFAPGQESFADAEDYAGWRFGLPIAKAVVVRPGSAAASGPVVSGWPRQP